MAARNPRVREKKFICAIIVQSEDTVRAGSSRGVESAESWNAHLDA